MLKSLLDKQKLHLDFFFANFDHTLCERLIEEILGCQGVLFFTGVGKSGFIAQKVAATMLSTGTKAFFLPPIDALHGDLGMVTKKDLVLILSKSGETEELGLAYKTSAPVVEELSGLRHYYTAQMQRLRPREMVLGFTLGGPHKDDLTIAIGSKEARFFASEGQQRSCTVALRLAEWKRLQTRTEVEPIMLLDDVGVSLDASRRLNLLSLIRSLKQVIITATEEPLYELPKESRLIELMSRT